jgi:hypothetical protein
MRHLLTNINFVTKANGAVQPGNKFNGNPQ